MPEVKVIPVGRQPIQLTLEHTVPIQQLTTIVLDACQMKEGQLIFKGKALTQEDQVQFKDNDVLIVSPVRRPRPMVTNIGDDEVVVDPDADITYQVDDSTSPFIKSLYNVLSRKLHVPKIVLYWLFSIRPINYVLFIVWTFLSPVAARYDLGPLYILGTIFVVMMTNLGVRRQGESSAYSWFNDGVRQLPGHLDAAQIDQQIRQGRM
eukprot:g9103.t1